MHFQEWVPSHGPPDNLLAQQVATSWVPVLHTDWYKTEEQNSLKPGSSAGLTCLPQPSQAFPGRRRGSQLNPAGICTTGMSLSAGAGRGYAGKSHHICLALGEKESHGANAALTSTRM